MNNEESNLSNYSNNTPQESTFNNPISTKHWILNMLVLAIPFVGFILLIAWAFGGAGAGEIKKGYARGNLILAVIFLIFYFGLIFLFIAMGIALDPLTELPAEP